MKILNETIEVSQVIETAETIKTSTIEDPIVMYLIVRESLNMSTGKTAAQVGHAVQLLMAHYIRYMQMDHYIQYTQNVDYGDYNDESVFSKEQVELIHKWWATDYRKVVLRANENEWKKIKEEFKEKLYLVVDNGLTELQANTETVIGLFPMAKSSVPKLIKRLQVLK